VIAYCYYQPCRDFQFHDEMAVWDLCRQSWERNGWTIYILGLEHAFSHPVAPKLFEAFAKRPTVCPWSYTMACYFRWLALAEEMAKHRGPAVMLDYDVINMSLTPADVARLYYRSTVMHPGRNPSTVYVYDCEDAERIIDMLQQHADPETEHGKPHVNDNVCFRQHWWGDEDAEIAAPYGELRGRERLIHFANRTIPAGQSKIAAIQQWIENHKPS